MLSQIIIASCTVAAFSTFGCPAFASSIILDSLNGANSSVAYADGFDPIISATFTTGAYAVHVDVALLLRAALPADGEPGDTVTISLDGGVPLSGLGPVSKVVKAGMIHRVICNFEDDSDVDGR